MEGYRVAPSPEVWTRVEDELRRRRRRRFLWWWLPGIVAGIGLSWLLAGPVPEAGEIKRGDFLMTEPTGRSAVEEKQTVDPLAKPSPGDDQPPEPIIAEREVKTSNDSAQDVPTAPTTVMHNRRLKFRGNPNPTTPSTPMPGKNEASEPDRRSVADQPASPLDQAFSKQMIKPDPTTSSGSKPLEPDTTSKASGIPKLTGSASDQDTAKYQTKPSAWIRSIGLGGGLSSIGGDLNGISGIGLSYGVNMQWYRPIGKSLFGIAAGIGVEGFTTKAGRSQSANLFNTSANLTTGTSDPQTSANGMLWLHRIDLPMTVHFSPHASRSARPSIAAGIIPGFIMQGSQLTTPAVNAPIRRWQLSLALEASAPLSNRQAPNTRQFMRLQAGLTELWNAPSAKGSRASLLQWGIRRTFR